MHDLSESLRAYVLEDDPDIAALEADLLREMGFVVVTCTRIVELGDLMDVALPHLMVVDVMLPDGDGGDITELLRTAWPGIWQKVGIVVCPALRMTGMPDMPSRPMVPDSTVAPSSIVVTIESRQVRGK